MARGFAESRCLLSPGLAQAPVMDVLCSHFVLTLTLRQAGRFNPRRDWNSLLALRRMRSCVDGSVMVIYPPKTKRYLLGGRRRARLRGTSRRGDYADLTPTVSAKDCHPCAT